MFVDLDNFKNVNDSFGHAHRRPGAAQERAAPRQGDPRAATRSRASAATSSPCCSKTSPSKEQVIEIAARIVESLQESLDLPGADMRIAASVGVAFSTPDDGVEELMRNADVAMYAAKAAGKGRYLVYETSMQIARRASARKWRREIDKALRDEPVPAALPADRRAAFGLPAGSRGADPLEAPGAGHDHAGGVHPGGRGDRADRAARPLGARAGLPRGARSGRRACRRAARCGSASTSPRSSSEVRHLRRREARARDLRDRPGLPRDRADRERADAEQRGGARDAHGAQDARRAHRDRRLRHRLLVADLPAPLPDRHPEDRPLVRGAARQRRRRRRTSRARSSRSATRSTSRSSPRASSSSTSSAS